MDVIVAGIGLAMVAIELIAGVSQIITLSQVV
jgi:hypothetical protein